MILQGDCRDVLPTLDAESVQCVVTSPPYWGLRDYGVDGQLGLESTPEEYVAKMVGVFGEVRRVLRPDGTLWLNLGDSYAANRSYQVTPTKWKGLEFGESNATRVPDGLKPKDLIGIPWRVAFALQADGWYLRSDVIWCLSGGARVYARTQKGEMPIAVKDLVRLDPATVQLWNGEKWTQVLGWNSSPDPRDGALELEIASGERIGCTPGHVWPTERGNVRADELREGDVILTTRLPEPPAPHSPAFIGANVAWLLGLYLAEGSLDSRGRIQIAGHAAQTDARLAAIRPLAEAFGGAARAHAQGDTATIIVDCPALTAIIAQYIHGRSAKTKGIKVRAWSHTDEWLHALLCGYLDGDGHYDAPNDRWRLGFTRNDRLAADLRTLAARLGLPLRLSTAMTTGFGKRWPIYRGQIRIRPSQHHNARQDGRVVAIRRSRARQFWDIGVADEPHLFALASGVLTHNSKPSPMPESVRDRPTKSHEYLFLLTKSERYFYDADAIAEPAAYAHEVAWDSGEDGTDGNASLNPKGASTRRFGADPTTRNARTVWTIPTKPFPDAHFAVFPPEIARRCILAGSRPGDTVLDPFSGAGTTGYVAQEHGRGFVGIELNPEYVKISERRTAQQTIWTEAVT